MRHRLQFPAFALLHLLLLAHPLWAQPPVDMPAELVPGETAPAFTLEDLRGTRFDLGEHLGRSAVVISFWSIYCDSCVQEMLSLQKLEDKYKGEGLVILAVNEDVTLPETRIRRFLERLERFQGSITYPVLFDRESAVFNRYGGTLLPTSVLIDSEGRISSYRKGYRPEAEFDLLSDIEALAGGREAVPPLAGDVDTQADTVTVTGSAGLCGFFDDSGWIRDFAGNESLDQELGRAREIALRDASRTTLHESLKLLGIELFSNPPHRDCVDGHGITLSRDPFDTHDPLSNLLASITPSRYFEILQQGEKLIGRDYFVTRKVRVLRDELADELESMGYIFHPLRMEFTYVNMTPLDQKGFLEQLLDQSRFVGRFEAPVFTPHSASQVFEVYTSSQGFADEILRMDFGELQLFVEEVTPKSLELEVWK